MIPRDLLPILEKYNNSMEVILLWGPRQTGKTTVLSQLPKIRSQVYLDDLQLRNLASSDPALFLDGYETPILIDECAYSPELFPEIKLRVDAARRKQVSSSKKRNTKTLYYLTGSSKSMLDRNVKESLAGRVRILTLSGLSVSEILDYKPNIPLKTILFKGGFPELYARPNLDPIPYLNDYITSYLEKDLAREEGMGKIKEFLNFLRFLAGRTGQFINHSEIATIAGVSVPTIQAWMELLEKNKIIELIPVYSTNLSKRLIKMKKLFFFDSGLAARLQGHISPETLWVSPQAGALFETLVVSEIQKTRDNHFKNWNLYTWRTKEKEEIDIILEIDSSRHLLIEIKLSSQKTFPWTLGTEAKKVFGEKIPRMIVTAGNKILQIEKGVTQVPITSLKKYLLDFSF